MNRKENLNGNIMIQCFQGNLRMKVANAQVSRYIRYHNHIFPCGSRFLINNIFVLFCCSFVIWFSDLFTDQNLEFIFTELTPKQAATLERLKAAGLIDGGDEGFST